MGYVSKKNRPYEWASKAQHSHVINDEAVQRIMSRCKLPSNREDVTSDISNIQVPIEQNGAPEIFQVLAVDGGYTEVNIQKSYPSSSVAFFQFGALLFKLADLLELGEKPFIHPDDMEKFKKLGRYKLALPSKCISLDGLSMIDSVRKSLYEFFNAPRTKTSYMDTLKWFLFHDYKFEGQGNDNSLSSIKLMSLPDDSVEISKEGVVVNKNDVKSNGDFVVAGKKYNLIDVFRFHEVVDSELGASGILGYLTNLIEHIVIIHSIKELFYSKPDRLSRFLFIKDGPLGFFGQTAKLHHDMRELCNYFIPKYGLKLVGLEKSGVFAEHADEITSGENPPLKPGNVLLLNNKYIYKHILPGPSSDEALDKIQPYAGTSYYSSKLIFRSESQRTWVLTIPVKDKFVVKSPKVEDFNSLNVILNAVDSLKCDMYDNAIVPVALVNQLVSLANHPSSKILEKFALQSVEK